MISMVLRKTDVLRLLEESRDDYHKSGDVGQEANVMQHIGGCYLSLGRLSDAESILVDALRQAEVVHDTQLQGVADT